MPNQAEVALTILTLVLAVVAVVGQQLRCVLEWGQRLLLALSGRRTLVPEPWQEHVAVPGRSEPFSIAATVRERIEQRHGQQAARAYGRARLRDLASRAGQG